jgi:hypothetical protein
MKSLSTILAAALVAGSCTVALAQGSGGGAGASGSGAADSTQQGTMKDADKNPTGAGANPAAGNTGSAPMTGGQAGTTTAPSGMTTAPASNTRSDNPQRPPAAKDSTGASTGSGGSK